MGFKPCDETAVMPLALRLLRVIGVWGDLTRYRYILVFVCYCFGIVIPKVCFGYPSAEASIRGYTELILETNVFAGMLMLYVRYDHFKLLVVELRSFVSIVFRDHSPSTPIRSNLVQLNVRLHKYTMLYCLYMCCVCTVYCFAPLWSNYSGYTSAINHQDNGSTVFQFNLYLEQGFYWLDNRTSLVGYCICTVFMFPLMYLCAYTGTVKVVAVFNLIKYCQAAIQTVAIKLEHLKTFRDVRRRTEAMSEVRDLHQRAMRCAELLELVLQPLLLMQLVLCILIWCTMMLYFSVSGINVKFINMFLLFLFVSIETFGYCYLGTQLSQESINVGKALYDADWIDYDAVMRKKVAFMIMRAQCRVGLTAAKFCFVDMEQFVAMLNMSYSIFVVLKDDDRAVLPLILYLQKHISLGDGSKRLYYPIVFSAFCASVVVPKLMTHYTNLETFICSMAELVFVGNVICGTMLLWMEYVSFAQFIEQTTSLTKYCKWPFGSLCRLYSTCSRSLPWLVYRDHQLYSVREYVLQFNRRIHRYTNKYCAFMGVLVVFYCLAPILTSLTAYFQSLVKSAGNDTSTTMAKVEFTLHMEETFYGLEQHTNIVHYILYTLAIVPMMFMTAVSVHTKLLTICCSVLYCETLLHIITLKVDNLHRMPMGNAARDELADIIQVHQRTLACIALLVKALRPVLLMQLVFCIFIWCLMMLYFTLADIGVKFINVGILFFVITIETLGQCYVGTRLSKQAEELTKCVYACGWQSMDREIQQELLMVLHRTQWPVGIQAGKFCFVDMERFQKCLTERQRGHDKPLRFRTIPQMVNVSYSFFIVLKDAF
uniref:Uncharacterized protein n=1 Tax=Anopheles stephensi TaxID=30069 RepID=A0A182YFW8_ANOST